MICKSFEVMKSYIIILSVDCNTHLHTLSKKQKKFECHHYRRKQRGAGHQVGGKRSFGVRQKFLADGVAGGSKIWPGDKNYFVWPGSSTIFYLNQKQKSYVYFKVGQFGICEKHGCPHL